MVDVTENNIYINSVYYFFRLYFELLMNDFQYIGACISKVSCNIYHDVITLNSSPSGV